MTICGPQTVAINAGTVSAGLGIVYEWQISGSSWGAYTNVSSGTGTNTTAYTTGLLGAGVYYYKLKTTCPSSTLMASSNQVTVTVKGMPNPTITATPNVICGTGTINLSASGAAFYNWNTNGSNNSTTSVTPFQSDIYYVTGINAPCPSVNSNTITVYYSPNPTITATSFSNVICAGATTTLSAAGANTYTWSNGASGSTVVATPLANTVYTATGFKANGCFSKGTVTVQVLAQPTVVVAGNTVICAGETTTLTASANGATSYSWSTSATTASAALSPLATTIYTAYGTNAIGCQGAATVAVISNSVPLITVAPSNASVCVGSPASFTASGASTYSWSTVSNNTMISISPAMTATYYVNGTNPAGCIATQTFALGTFSLPTVTITPSSPTVCALTQMTLSASGANTYTWNNTVVSPTFTPSPAATVIYTVSGTETINNCVNSQTIEVFVIPLPVITISPSSPAFCFGGSTQVFANGLTTFTWEPNGGNGSMATLNPTASTIYTLSGSSAASGCSASQTINVVVFSLPTVQVSPALQTICSNKAATVTATGATSFIWESIGFAGSSVTLSANATAMYTVSGSDINGCSDVKSFTVNVNPSPTLQVTPSQLTICLNETASFTATGAPSYTWSQGNNNTGVFSVVPVASSQYTVTGGNSFGCSDVAVVVITVDECTSIENGSLNSKLVRVYPNPSSGSVNIDFGRAGVTTIQVINSLGQVLESKTSELPAEQLNFSAYAKGLYYIKLVSDGKEENFRIVIQ